MNYVDTTLVRLADPATRAPLFDAVALEQIVRAAYDTASMPVAGPFQAVFDDFQLGFAVPPAATLEGAWGPVGGVERFEARFHLLGLGGDSPPRVDALWRGSVVARVPASNDRVTAVGGSWPDAGRIDADIEADLGALPADPAALEQERRTRFLDRVRATLHAPTLFTGAALDAWLREVGAESVGDLLTRYRGTVHAGAVQVTFAPPDPVPPSPRALPVAAALLIRDADFSVGDLLAESKTVRARLEGLGLHRPPDPALRPRQPLLTVWVVPGTVFDDADWPGAAAGMTADQARAARRAAAGAWLAREGIGLVATP
jgi:hypothetical protein